MHSAITHKNNHQISYNIHIFEENDPQIERHLNFCAFLSKQEKYAKEYVELKAKLAKQYQNHSFNYTLHKGELIHKIDALAKVNSIRNDGKNNLALRSVANPMSETDLIMSAKLNLYLFLTHYAQYIPEIKFIRIPGYTLINTGIQDIGYNHILDVHYPLDTITTKVRSLISQSQLDNIPYQWWLDLCENGDCIKKLIQSSSIENKYYFSKVHLSNESTDKFGNYEIRLLTTKHDILTYRGINRTYLKKIAEIPHSEFDPIQHYELILKNKTIGNFTLVFYAKVIGIFWLNILTGHDLSAIMLKVSKMKLQLNYNDVIIFNDNSNPFFVIHSLVIGAK